jgi:2-polyprenyl-3-methyl-5-hydroxy-6-metoxy-1,4-benzoquinol methylase
MFNSLYDHLRRITPQKIRKWFKKQRWFMPVLKLTIGSGAYSKSYYDDCERIESKSTKIIADWIYGYFRPKRIIDIGCGPGHLMDALRRHGVDTFGVDISKEAIEKAREKGLSVSFFDLTKNDVIPGIPYDLAISCEVAEHLEERFARTFVEKLTAAAEVIFMTAAEPGSTGLYHFNEQPHEYWIALMKEYGFKLDNRASDDARNALHVNGVVAYLQSPMIFRKCKP